MPEPEPRKRPFVFPHAELVWRHGEWREMTVAYLLFDTSRASAEAALERLLAKREEERDAWVNILRRR
jgi:hypothetical protein